MQDYKRYRPDVYHRAETLEEVADAIGVDPATLRATVDRWNQNVRDGKDTDHGRRHLGNGVAQGPFYALSPMNVYVTLADGGLGVDDQLRVVREDRTPVPHGRPPVRVSLTLGRSADRTALRIGVGDAGPAVDTGLLRALAQPHVPVVRSTQLRRRLVAAHHRPARCPLSIPA
ncbi:FAD-binding protein [Streptomyces coelicoflavus]|uniref:FAD-binding protein n=1 Tax=Streptomyces coelicoflavus TaxID=285562 RepID=UPI0034509C2E